MSTFPRRRTSTVVPVLAMVLGVLGMVEIWRPLPSRNFAGDPVLSAVSVWVFVAALALRRLAPVALPLGATAVFGLLHFFGPLYGLFYGGAVPVLIMMFAGVRWGPRRAPLLCALAGFGYETALVVSEPAIRADPNTWGFEYGGMVLVWTAAFLLRLQARRVERTTRRTVTAEVATASRVLAAVRAERRRIGEDLDRTVGASLTTMITDCAAIETLASGDPEPVRDRLARLRRTGVDTMTAMRGAVARLRAGPEPVPTVATRTRRFRWTDLANLLVASTLGALAMIEIWAPLRFRRFDGDPVLTAVAAWLLVAAMVVRRWRPVGALVVGCGGYLLLHLLGPIYDLFYGQLVPVLIMMFGAVRWGRRPAPAAAGATVLGLQVFMTVIEPEFRADLNEFVFEYGVVVVVWVAALGLRRQAARVRSATAREIEMETAGAQREILAVQEERVRMARELHDVVGHAISTMVVLAGAAEQVAEDDPAHVRRTSETVRRLVADARIELARLVGLLTGPEQGGLGIAALPELVRSAGTSGLAVDFARTGAVRPLGPAVELTAYCIVQEALTNVRRHARATRVSVALDYRPGDLAIEVRDDGVGGAATSGGGYGLTGMRERVAQHGGRIETESDGGYTIRAVLPT